MSRTLPANLPAIATANLPRTYEAAKAALAECSRVDECRDWADRAEALASYARQSDDEDLEHLAIRIRGRAIRRCGEILMEIENGQGARTDRLGVGTDPKLSRAQAARDAGLSPRQKREALRVARVPGEEFEAALAGDDPPTAAALAARGKRPAPLVDLKGRDPADFKLATEALGRVAALARFAAESDPAAIARGVFPKERRALCVHVITLRRWLVQIERRCRGGGR